MRSLRSLSECCKLITDGTHYTPPPVADGIPFLTVKDMTDKGLDMLGSSRMTHDEFERAIAGNSAPQQGDVLFSKDGTVGKVHVVRDEGKFAVLSSIAILRPDPSYVDSEFLGYMLRHKSVLHDALNKKTGSAIRRLVLRDLKSVKIPVPPLPEQRRIVDLLSRAEGIVRLRQEAEKKAAELIPALFLDMFGDPATNPKGWRTIPTGEIVQLTNGRAFKPAEWCSEGTPIIRIQNLNDPSKPFNYYAGNLPEKYKVRAGDVLLSWSGTPGTSFGCFRWQRDVGWLNQHIFNVRVAEHINEDFFIHQINLRLPELIGRAHGGVGLQHFTKGALESLPFIVPSTTDQESFGEQAAQADSIQKQQSAATAKAQAVFDALLAQTFSA